MLGCCSALRRFAVLVAISMTSAGTLAEKSIGVAEVEVQPRKLTKSRKTRKEIGSHSGRRRSGDCYLIGGDRFLAKDEA
jgi:hypothetical protein